MDFYELAAVFVVPLSIFPIDSIDCAKPYSRMSNNRTKLRLNQKESFHSHVEHSNWYWKSFTIISTISNCPSLQAIWNQVFHYVRLICRCCTVIRYSRVCKKRQMYWIPPRIFAYKMATWKWILWNSFWLQAYKSRIFWLIPVFRICSKWLMDFMWCIFTKNQRRGFWNQNVISNDSLLCWSHTAKNFLSASNSKANFKVLLTTIDCIPKVVL